MTGMPAKPTVYIELCRQTSTSVSLNVFVLRDSFTLTSLGEFSCSCQRCITHQSCMSMERRCLRDEPVPFIAVCLHQALLGSLTDSCGWPGVQFNSPCQNECVCLVFLLEAQILELPSVSSVKVLLAHCLEHFYCKITGAKYLSD